MSSLTPKDCGVNTSSSHQTHVGWHYTDPKRFITGFSLGLKLHRSNINYKCVGGHFYSIQYTSPFHHFSYLSACLKMFWWWFEHRALLTFSRLTQQSNYTNLLNLHTIVACKFPQMTIYVPVNWFRVNHCLCMYSVVCMLTQLVLTNSWRSSIIL